MTQVRCVPYSVLLLVFVFFPNIGFAQKPWAEDISTQEYLELLQGLSAQPGTLERRKSGELLKTRLEIAKRNLDINTESTDQALVSKVFDFTIQYLKSERQCKPEEKIRLYRGIGDAPLFRPNGVKPEDGIILFLHENWSLLNWAKQSNRGLQWTGKNNLNGAPQLDGEDLAQVAWGLIQKGDPTGLHVPALSWSFGRKCNDQQELDCWASNRSNLVGNAEYNWNYLSSIHIETSEHSPFISTSQYPKVAEAWGPGWVSIEVCPERAIWNLRDPKGPKTFDGGGSGWELIIPFFILPEEIIEVQGYECFYLTEEQRKTHGMCNHLQFSNSTSGNTLYQTLSESACPKDQTSGQKVDFSRTVGFYFEVLKSSQSVEEFRTKLSAFHPTCKANCSKFMVSSENSTVPIYQYSTPSKVLTQLGPGQQVQSVSVGSSEVEVLDGPDKGVRGWIDLELLKCSSK